MIERLQFIRGGQRLGLKLRDIQELLRVQDRGVYPCGHSQALIRRRLTELDAELSDLRSLRKKLARLARQLPKKDGPEGTDDWPCRREFIRIGGELDDDQ